MAAPVSSAKHATGNNVDVNVQVPGITIVATPHAHGETTLTLNNTTDHDITVRVVGGHGHGGSEAGGQVVTVRAHEYASVTLGGGVKQWYVEPGPVQHSTVTTPQTTPEKAPDPIIVTGTVETFTELSPVPQVVVQTPTTETELETTDPQTPPPKLEVPTPEVTVMQTPSFTVTGTHEQTPPDVPQLTPPDPTQQTPPMVPQGVPTPVDQKVPEPMLVPPLPDPQVTTTQVTTTQVTTEQGGPLTTTEQGPVTSPDTTQTPITDTGVPDASLPVGAMSKPVLQTPSTTAGGHVTQGTTHHASHPGHVTATAVDGDHAPSGELAHTGGNTAILAIVAGALLAAGAGLAVASRVGKDEQPGT
jgi:LPXTG-motif cell wall-anchored protein